MKRRLILLAGVFLPYLAFAQPTPPMRPYTTLPAPAIDLNADMATGEDINQSPTGDILGTWPNLYLAPNITITSSATIGNAINPQITLQSTLASNPITFWQDINGNGNFSTNSTNSSFSFYTYNGALEVHDTGIKGAAKINLYGQNNPKNPSSIWQDATGSLSLSTGSPNSNTSIYTSGTGKIELYSHHVQMHDGVLDLFGPGQSNPAAIWQDQYANMYIASQVGNSWLNIQAAGIGKVDIRSPIRNSNIPTHAPSSGSHFVCVDDAGDMYRSDTSCR
ncbi:hypothetical protein GS501_00630 [Saccharibacter sp. 17.LH.SD]|uniref:hypothetical protein n=1 Tax=Saccharibacter sp. 17.LH.SD TaxID=2689393 RepID=UPI00136BDEE6|nr:hypothetical protein [Saccharibacter sp. 17.LH.SD]MXV43584.1 hypothetical protein [Saccharibacter sp. 17.LH.SD]